MDSKGYNTINQALKDADINARVMPEPREHEDVRFITIETGPTLLPAYILNALGDCGLIAYDGLALDVTEMPQLKVIGAQPGSVTLEDINHEIV